MRIASISFWHLHGADYALDAQRHPDLELVGIWDDDAERGRAGAEQHGVPFIAALDTILDDPTIEGVIVCAPTSEHVEIVLRCIRAGKHVFMEKVLSADLAGAQLIADAAREAGVALTVSLWRSDRGYAQQIRQLIEDGVVGTVTSARIRDGHPFALPTAEQPDGRLPERFYDPVEAQGGALIDLCHPLYLLAKLIGLPRTVMAAFGEVTERGVEDNAAVLLSYPGGAIGIAETSYVTRVTPFIIEVHGTEGSILYSEPGIGALVAAHGGDVPEHPTPDDEPRLRYRSAHGTRGGWQALEVRHDEPTALNQWVVHATSGSRGDGNIDLALALSALVQAAYESVRDRRAVELPSLIRPRS